MKIYHKKNFTFGLFALLLGALNLARSALQGFDRNDGVLVGLLLLLAGWGMWKLTVRFVRLVGEKRRSLA